VIDAGGAAAVGAHLYHRVRAAEFERRHAADRGAAAAADIAMEGDVAAVRPQAAGVVNVRELLPNLTGGPRSRLVQLHCNYLVITLSVRIYGRQDR